MVPESRRKALFVVFFVSWCLLVSVWILTDWIHQMVVWIRELP